MQSSRLPDPTHTSLGRSSMSLAFCMTPLRLAVESLEASLPAAAAETLQPTSASSLTFVIVHRCLFNVKTYAYLHFIVHP